MPVVPTIRMMVMSVWNVVVTIIRLGKKKSATTTTIWNQRNVPVIGHATVLRVTVNKISVPHARPSISSTTCSSIISWTTDFHNIGWKSLLIIGTVSSPIATFSNAIAVQRREYQIRLMI
jgi:hypothetical protein